MYIILLVIVAILLVWTAVSYFFDRSIKTPEYTVVKKSAGYEIRSYKPYITAQVEVSGTYDEALNQGFRVLADYIFGNNTKQTGIAMTAPVTEAESEKMAMTAPVMEKESEVLAMTAPVVETG
ncbi:MAG: heme-binding protein, partial [Candidatus Yanofskybacteria bacterium]|nr:heme-binding protein [Candidatus Yanofskybacteria bacterium]